MIRLPNRDKAATALCNTNTRHLVVSWRLLIIAATLLICLNPAAAFADEALAAPQDDGAFFTNSELRPDAADPCIIKVDDTYYLFATTSNKSMPFYASTDLKTWTEVGNAFAGSAFEGTGLTRGDIWAPEVKERTVNGRTTYVLTYTAANYWDGKYRICVAEATQIAPGAFARPKVIDTGGVRNAIDSDLYFEGESTWVYFKNEDDYHSICVERLGSDWSRVSGPTTVLRMDLPWESWTIEGPWMIKLGSTYYLMYSSGGYTTSNYCIGYATSSSPMGPFTKVTTTAPLVRSQLGVIGPGHNSTLMISEGEIYLVYHSLHKAGEVDRRLMIDRMGVDDDGRMFVNFAGFGHQPLPSGTRGYYQVGAQDYSVSAYGTTCLTLSDVVSSQSGSEALNTVESSSFRLDIAEGYRISDVWLFGGHTELGGTAELVIDGTQVVSGYQLSGTGTKLTLPDSRQYVRTIDINLSSVQSLSEILLVSRGQRWAPLSYEDADPPEGVYVIQSALKTDMVLDNAGNSMRAGSNVLLWRYKGTSNQQWVLSYDDIGLATFTNVSSGMSLDATGARCARNTNVEQWTPNGGQAQKWSIVPNGDGTYTLAAAVGNKMVVDVAGAKSNNGTNVALWSRNGGRNQRWRLIPLDPGITTDGMATVDDGYYILHPKCAPGLSLDVAGGSLANGGNLIVWPSSGTANQCFRISRQDSGFYRIESALSGKVVDIANCSPISGTNALQWTGKGSSNQEWAIYEGGDGSFTIRNVGTGLMLDVTGGSNKPGTNVEGWHSNGSSAQAWFLDSVASPVQHSVDLAAEGQGVLPEGTYAIGSSADDGQVLDVSWASRDDGANVTLWRKNGGENQLWEIRYDDDGLATIHNVNSGLALAFANLRKCGNVAQASPSESVLQKWVIINNGDGTITIAAAIDPSYVLDVYGGNPANGTNIQIYPRNGGANQRFRCFSAGVPVEDAALVSTPDEGADEALMGDETVEAGADEVPPDAVEGEEYVDSNVDEATSADEGIEPAGGFVELAEDETADIDP